MARAERTMKGSFAVRPYGSTAGRGRAILAAAAANASVAWAAAAGARACGWLESESAHDPGRGRAGGDSGE